MMSLRLYELPGCPYCAKVKDTLADLDLDYESVEVPSAHSARDEV
ncbi:MAG: glutaredoxin, partial [Actinobacteria bacterium]|nr:glutaredoxin [Actinomycetota bacterium]NIU71599.1 glutaredoxin [Actinomycetota bacterium]NIW33554.1 glutaredoxin [Actinomycetota bacterium]NIX25658.1 glutaredoxin [Actinomycetota bacterium]